MNAMRSFAQQSLLWIGSLCGIGRLPASGTVAVAVVGVPLFMLTRGLSAWNYSFLLIAVTGASVWIHDVGDRILGEKDSRKLVWDEIVGFLIAVAGLPFTWPLAAFAFVIERAIDIAKVPPARQIEKHWPGGWGVVGDDVVAGLYTCVILHLMIRIAPQLAFGSP